MERKRWWNKYTSWKEAECSWDEGAERAEKDNPIRVLTVLPSMPGIAEETKRHLSWKSFKWMVAKDENLRVARHILKRPFFHAYRYLRSLFSREPYRRDGDFFLYGLRTVDDFKKKLFHPDTLLVVGFSYCEKPFECPSGRFTDKCIHDPGHPVCRQCFIGKAVNSLPEERTVPLFIPTIHYIAERLFEIIEAHPKRRVLFLITACEMTLEMFGDWGNMAGVEGIGVRLDGRICNTMKAFELSEQGIKPGLTVLLEPTKARILELLELWREQHVITPST